MAKFIPYSPLPNLSDTEEAEDTAFWLFSDYRQAQVNKKLGEAQLAFARAVEAQDAEGVEDDDALMPYAREVVRYTNEGRQLEQHQRPEVESWYGKAGQWMSRTLASTAPYSLDTAVAVGSTALTMMAATALAPTVAGAVGLRAGGKLLADFLRRRSARLAAAGSSALFGDIAGLGNGTYDHHLAQIVSEREARGGDLTVTNNDRKFALAAGGLDAIPLTAVFSRLGLSGKQASEVMAKVMDAGKKSRLGRLAKGALTIAPLEGVTELLQERIVIEALRESGIEISGEELKETLISAARDGAFVGAVLGGLGSAVSNRSADDVKAEQGFWPGPPVTGQELSPSPQPQQKGKSQKGTPKKQIITQAERQRLARGLPPPIEVDESPSPQLETPTSPSNERIARAKRAIKENPEQEAEIKAALGNLAKVIDKSPLNEVMEGLDDLTDVLSTNPQMLQEFKQAVDGLNLPVLDAVSKRVQQKVQDATTKAVAKKGAGLPKKGTPVSTRASENNPPPQRPKRKWNQPSMQEEAVENPAKPAGAANRGFTGTRVVDGLSGTGEPTDTPTAGDVVGAVAGDIVLRGQESPGLTPHSKMKAGPNTDPALQAMQVFSDGAQTREIATMVSKRLREYDFIGGGVEAMSPTGFNLAVVITSVPSENTQATEVPDVFLVEDGGEGAGADGTVIQYQLTDEKAATQADNIVSDLGARQVIARGEATADMTKLTKDTTLGEVGSMRIVAELNAIPRESHGNHEEALKIFARRLDEVLPDARGIAIVYTNKQNKALERWRDPTGKTNRYVLMPSRYDADTRKLFLRHASPESKSVKEITDELMANAVVGLMHISGVESGFSVKQLERLAQSLSRSDRTTVEGELTSFASELLGLKHLAEKLEKELDPSPIKDQLIDAIATTAFDKTNALKDLLTAADLDQAVMAAERLKQQAVATQKLPSVAFPLLGTNKIAVDTKRDEVEVQTEARNRLVLNSIIARDISKGQALGKVMTNYYEAILQHNRDVAEKVIALGEKVRRGEMGRPEAADEIWALQASIQGVQTPTTVATAIQPEKEARGSRSRFLAQRELSPEDFPEIEQEQIEQEQRAANESAADCAAGVKR